MENQSSSEKKSTTELEKLVKELVAKGIEEATAHDCFSCGWFKLSEKKPRNRYCTYPGPLKLARGICQMWKFEPDSEMRNRGFC